MEAMDAADLYRQGEDGESAKSMSPDAVTRWMELVDRAAPLIQRAEVEDAEWEAYVAGIEGGSEGAETVE